MTPLHFRISNLMLGVCYQRLKYSYYERITPELVEEDIVKYYIAIIKELFCYGIRITRNKIK